MPLCQRPHSRLAYRLLLAEELRGRGDELPARHPRASFSRFLLQREQEPRFRPMRRVRGDPEALRNCIRASETDSGHVGREAPWIGADPPGRISAIQPVDAGGQDGGETAGLQEDHHLPDVLLPPPGSLDLLRPHFADALDLSQPRRLRIDDTKRFGAELPHQA